MAKEDHRDRDDQNETRPIQLTDESERSSDDDDGTSSGTEEDGGSDESSDRSNLIDSVAKRSSRQIYEDNRGLEAYDRDFNAYDINEAKTIESLISDLVEEPPQRTIIGQDYAERLTELAARMHAADEKGVPVADYDPNDLREWDHEVRRKAVTDWLGIDPESMSDDVSKVVEGLTNNVGMPGWKDLIDAIAAGADPSTWTNPQEMPTISDTPNDSDDADGEPAKEPSNYAKAVPGVGMNFAATEEDYDYKRGEDGKWRDRDGNEVHSGLQEVLEQFSGHATDNEDVEQSSFSQSIFEPVGANQYTDVNEWLGAFQGGDASSTLHEGETTAATLREGARDFFSDTIANFEDAATASGGTKTDPMGRTKTDPMGRTSPGQPRDSDSGTGSALSGGGSGDGGDATKDKYDRYDRAPDDTGDPGANPPSGSSDSGDGGSSGSGDNDPQGTNGEGGEDNAGGQTSSRTGGSGVGRLSFDDIPDEVITGGGSGPTENTWVSEAERAARKATEEQQNNDQNTPSDDNGGAPNGGSDDGDDGQEKKGADAGTSTDPDSEPVAGGIFEEWSPTPQSSDLKPWTGQGDIDPPEESSGDVAAGIDDGTATLPGKVDLIGQPATPDSQSYLAPPPGEEPTLGPDPNVIDPGDEPSDQREMGSDEPGTAPGTIGSEAESELDSPVAAQESFSESEVPDIPQLRELNTEDLIQIDDPTADASDVDPLGDALMGS